MAQVQRQRRARTEAAGVGGEAENGWTHEPGSWRKLGAFSIAKLLISLGLDLAYSRGRLPLGGWGRALALWQLYRERLPVLLSAVCPTWVPLLSIVWLFKVRARTFEEDTGEPRGSYLAHLLPIKTMVLSGPPFAPDAGGGAGPMGGTSRGGVEERRAQARPGEILGFDVSNIADGEVVELSSMAGTAGTARRRHR
eukprot:TRINITY_DN19945_c0_g1_i1.p2 TRINITY_DN19945_c0_g1~~TRINITY_DN19945_c0_g1_i1.p2  ORF type:complete len:196 (+),score=24.59 TRINITY_DN19945_c0_g1_i1:114-701(+)